MTTTIEQMRREHTEQGDEYARRVAALDPETAAEWAAIEAANEFFDGEWWAALAVLADFLSKRQAAPVSDGDDLIAAMVELEVAVDDYTSRAWAYECKRAAYGYGPGSSSKQEDGAFLSKLGGIVVDAATRVALAMVDADVDGAESSQQIPVELRPAAADAEVAALRGNAKLVKQSKCSRCAGTGQFVTYVENGQPKGPGGICFRCNGKGVQTLDDRRRNYGHDMNITLY
jgi:hypothetical protein